MRTYRAPRGGLSGVLYALTTSIGMIGIVVALVGGVLAGVLAGLAGVSADGAFGLGVVSAVVFFVIAGAAARSYLVRDQSDLEVRFPLAAGASAAQSEER
jgi:hypothetical protein